MLLAQGSRTPYLGRWVLHADLQEVTPDWGWSRNPLAEFRAPRTGTMIWPSACLLMAPNQYNAKVFLPETLS
jgi:hypothetical protein